MPIVDIFAALSGLIASFAALYSFREAITSRRAMRELSSKLANHQKHDKLIATLRELQASSNVRNKEAYAKALQFIRSEISRLSETERQQVLEALNQPSLKGRRAYVTKVMEETANNLAASVR